MSFQAFTNENGSKSKASIRIVKSLEYSTLFSFFKFNNERGTHDLYEKHSQAVNSSNFWKLIHCFFHFKTQPLTRHRTV
jgi:hypothetical protein